MKRRFSFLIILVSLIVTCFAGCSILSKKQYQELAEDAARQIVANDLKSPGTAVWNECTYLEDDGNNYVVYVDVEAANSFGAYLRSRFFVIVSNIDLNNETFEYSKLFPYIECTGKNDSYNLNVIKRLNKYGAQSGGSGDNGGGEEKPEPDDKFVVTFVNNGTVVSKEYVDKNGASVSAPSVQRDNYNFVGWFLDGQQVSFPYSVNGSVTFTAKWEGVICQYVTNHNGNRQTYEIKYGENVKINSVSEQGYKFKGWYYGDTQITDANGNALSPWAYTQQIELTPKFELITFTVIYNVNSEYYGSVVYQGDPLYYSSFGFELSVLNDYTAPIVAAVPNEGYRFVKWSDGSTNPVRQDINIQTDKEITAEFVRVYTFNFVAEEGGTITGETTQTVDEGKTAAPVTAVANDGYIFKYWEYGDYAPHYYYSPTIAVSDSDNWSYADTFTAVFEKIVYTVEYDTDPYWGGGLLRYVYSENSGDKHPAAYNPDGVDYAEFDLSIDNNFTAPEITAVPNEGYRFVKWSDGSTNPVRQDINIQTDKEITAEFVRVYTFNFVAEEGGTVTGETTQTVEEGKTAAPVTAVADDGYIFKYWEYGDFSPHYYYSPTIEVSNSENWSYADTFTAVFERITT